MIQRFILGEPITTDAVVKEIAVSEGNIPFFKYDSADGFSYHLVDTDIVYGLGEQIRGINKRGWKYTSENTDNPHHQEDTASLYGAHNFLIVSGEQLFGVFLDYPGKMTFDIGYTHGDTITITAPDYNMNLYFFTGENELAIVKQFRQLIGRSYIAPKWAFGYGQSRWGYKDEKDIREVAEKYKENGFPLDAIYLDIDYMEDYKDFTINEERFPDFEKLVKDMRAQGIHLVPIIDAGVKIEPGYETYEEGIANNYFCKDQDGNDFVAAVWPGRVHFPDVLNPEARKWFGEKYAFLIDKGIDGFWNDMNEPALFYTDDRLKNTVKTVNELTAGNPGIEEFFKMMWTVNTLGNNPEDYASFYHMMDGKKVRHDQVHNLFGYNMTRAASEAFDSICPDKRLLMFSRSSYIGAHRYGGIWQGDNKSWWSHLLMNMQMTCNLNMTGFLYTGADLGGFGSDTTEDLLLRWYQFALFTPLMRNHSAMRTREQEAYRFDTMEACRRMIEIRYGLLPYLYSEYMKAVLRDDMMFYPLGFVYDDEVSKHTEDQVFLGKELMLAPIYTQNATGRHVWLPEEMMLVRMRSLNDYDTEILPAGHHYVSAKLDELIFFIRTGKAIPLCSGGQNVDELSTNDMKMFGYDGATYELYNDDGLTKTYTEENITILS